MGSRWGSELGLAWAGSDSVGFWIGTAVVWKGCDEWSRASLGRAFIASVVAGGFICPTGGPTSSTFSGIGGGWEKDTGCCVPVSGGREATESSDRPGTGQHESTPPVSTVTEVCVAGAVLLWVVAWGLPATKLGAGCW
jgi:hypothetical protein